MIYLHSATVKLMNRLFLLFTLLLVALAANASADETAIIATVGDSAITTQDLINRTKLIIISSGLKADEETARKIAPEILQGLINEHLEIEEANKQQITVSDDEINKAISGIEQQNKMQPGQLKEILKKANIPFSNLQQQVKGQIAWAKIRSKKIQPKIVITDDEINDYIKTQNMAPLQTEYNVTEIVLPVETAKDDAKERALGDKLVNSLNNGADFKKNCQAI